MSSAPPGSNDLAEPVLLLKTKSIPTDAYEELLAAPDAPHGRRFAPRFVPVLEHRFEEAGLDRVRSLLRERRVSAEEDSSFGGLVFTSQRAVEAFAKLVAEGAGDDPRWPHLQDIPLYSVGPATTRALRAIPQVPPLQIFGEHTGNGEALAAFILDHYGQWYRDRPVKPPLLFLVGEQRRDIIPKTLMNGTLPVDRRIAVTEEIVYGTGVMQSFPADFDHALGETQDRRRRWVVVFSPTGCDSMLRGLGMLDRETGMVKPDVRDGKTFIATIGPTTRDYLLRTFDFAPDVCAKKPSPEGVLDGIISFKSGAS